MTRESSFKINGSVRCQAFGGGGGSVTLNPANFSCLLDSDYVWFLCKVLKCKRMALC